MWLSILFASLPLYLVRFPVFGFPTTALECLIVAAIVATVYKLSTDQTFQEETKKRLRFLRSQKILLVAVVLFTLGATLGVYYSLHVRAALGEWKAFYIEPIVVALLAFLHIRSRRDIETLLSCVLASGIVLGLYTVYQRLTGNGVPFAFWENGASYRVTGWYGFPNAVGQALFPVAILAGGFFLALILEKKNDVVRSLFFVSALFLSLLGILFAKSTGSLLAVMAGAGIFLLAFRRTRIPSLVIGVAALVVVCLLPTTNSVKQEVLAQNRSGQIRVAMWHEATWFLRDHPFTGAGLSSYTDRITPYHAPVHGESIEIFHHPHNMLLTMWVNIGLIGFIGYTLLLVWLGITGVRFLRNGDYLGIMIFAVVGGFFVAGLVDSPYIKNDMSVLFWLLPSISISILYERITRESTSLRG